MNQSGECNAISQTRDDVNEDADFNTSESDFVGSFAHDIDALGIDLNSLPNDFTSLLSMHESMVSAFEHLSWFIDHSYPNHREHLRFARNPQPVWSEHPRRYSLLWMEVKPEEVILPGDVSKPEIQELSLEVGGWTIGVDSTQIEIPSSQSELSDAPGSIECERLNQEEDWKRHKREESPVNFSAGQQTIAMPQSHSYPKWIDKAQLEYSA